MPPDTRTPKLAPIIGLGRLVGLTFAVIAPGSSVFLTYGTAFAQAGTGIVFGYGLGALLNLTMMWCYAELGSRYPEAGGDYSLASRALGRWAGSLYAVLFAVKGVAIPGLLALSSAQYIHLVWPAIPATPLALAVFASYIALAGFDLKTSSTVVNLMVAIEFLVFLMFVVTGLTHLHQPASVLWTPQRAIGQGLSRVPRGVWLGAATAALYGLNGPQACLYYSEETLASPKHIGRTIFGAALTTVGIEMAGVIIGTLALPTLASSTNMHLAAIMHQALGPAGRLVMLLGIGVALYDTGLATTMSYGRIFYAIARDAQWPGILNRVMSRISRTGVPIGALLVLGAVNMAVMASSSIQMLVTLGGTLLMVVYAGIATASILDRIRQRRAPYQMPWWPIPPLAALAGLALLVGHLSRFHLILTGLVTLLGLTWAWASPTPRDL